MTTLQEYELLSQRILQLNAIPIAAWNRATKQTGKVVDLRFKQEFLAFRAEFLSQNLVLKEQIDKLEAEARPLLRVIMEEGRLKHIARTKRTDDRKAQA